MIHTYMFKTKVELLNTMRYPLSIKWALISFVFIAVYTCSMASLVYFNKLYYSSKYRAAIYSFKIIYQGKNSTVGILCGMVFILLKYCRS